MEVHSFVSNTVEIEQKLLKAELDAAVVEGEIHSPDLIVIPIIDDSLVLTAGVHHPFYEKESRESLNKIKAFLLELLIDGGCPLNAESDRAEAPADNGAGNDSERASGGAEQAESVHS